MWAPNLPALAAERQVITWDIRGHGRSGSPPDPSRYSDAASVADMSAVLDACGITRAAVGGLSLGGYLSLAFHVADPARVAALLLFDTGPGFKQNGSRERWNAYAASRADALERDGLAALSTSVEVGPGRPVRLGSAGPPRAALSRAVRGSFVCLPRTALPPWS